ncbi:MAG: asparagine--tRNA ligase [Candidatus Krumholzibacteria bacterium]|nr:asparagine--tRNA ligase [Candidatus Krumholzibacteria bacterium]
MQPVEISEIAGSAGRQVLLRGWLRNRRSSGGILFLELRDGTGTVQCVASKSVLGAEAFERAGKLPCESCIEIEGTAIEDPRAPGGLEVSVTALRIVRAAGARCARRGSPGAGVPGDRRHLELRESRQAAILRIRAGVSRYIRDFLDAGGFVQCDAPVLRPGAGERGAGIFEIPYFGDRAFLSGGAGPYNEAAAAVLRKVYSFGPVFTARGAGASGELTESWMVEPEWAFASLGEIMALAEDLVSEVARRCLVEQRGLLEGVMERKVGALALAQRPFPRIEFREAAAILSNFDRPLFVHRLPAASKAFSVEEDPRNPLLSLSFELFAPGSRVAMIEGAQRAYDTDFLKRRIGERGLPEKGFGLSLDLSRCGGFPHSGFSLCLERLLAWICGAGDPGETIPFPRTASKLTP